MAFDGIVTKAIASELQELSGARIDKIFQPNKNNLILGFYLNGMNYALNICTDSQNYRINLTTHPKPNPQVAPNFCMLLRKHLLGLRLKNVITSNLERVITIEFEGFDDVDDIIHKKLIIELMGKHCNIILLDDSNTIIDSLRHITCNSDNQSTRNIVPHSNYVYPTVSKENLLEIENFNEFKKKLNISTSITDINLIADLISTTFNGISKSFITSVINNLDIENSEASLEKIYLTIMDIISATDNPLNLSFKPITNNITATKQKKDYTLYMCSQENNNDNFRLNFFIDDWYYSKETSENFKTYRNSVLKLILDSLKKYNTKLLHINKKLEDCEDMDIYRIYGELITANLYRIKDKNISEITLENYYDNNSPITIPLDKKYTPSTNAKMFFKKYTKLKNALTIVTTQKEETLQELNYIESIVYELENCQTIEEVAEIYNEISENVIFKEKTSSSQNTNDFSSKNKFGKIKKSSLTKNKTVTFNPLKYTIENYTLLVGRNNKENDYLTLKYAKKNDIWFHTKDFHGSHAILQIKQGLPQELPPDDILVRCAQIAAYHSKARNSSNVPVDYCEVKYVKKPSGSKPGMVIYTNNKTLNVMPSL